MKHITKKDIKRVLIVGSWAKEMITIENLAKNPGLEMFSYMDIKNPGIISLVKDFQLGDLKDNKLIIRYAKKNNIDLVIVTTAYPLSSGLIDLLKKENILCFGPEKAVAQLETDKAFTRKLMQKYKIEGLPRFKVFNNIRSANNYAESLNCQVAVKPTGLTDGLGVKVSGDQLHNSKEIKQYIRKILLKKNAKVLIEEKIKGEEFTLQCFVNDNIIIPMPLVQDFKKLLKDDKGPNTASMGSYSMKSCTLPFVNNDDYRTALEIMKKTISAVKHKVGVPCQGFLYGQFMITDTGIKLIEYNFRPGDPEWVNVISILKDNILDIIINLLNKKNVKLNFNKQATVCKYLVPKDYPYKRNQILKIKFNGFILNKMGVKFYYSCGYDNKNLLNVGSERGIALIATGNSVLEANRKLEQVISYIKGSYYYRNDIGSKTLLERKRTFDKIRRIKEKINIKNVFQKDFLKVYSFVKDCKPLKPYAEHFYKIILRYFGNTCYIAEYKNDLVGFVMGFFSQTQNNTYFLWQIGVHPSMQGKGVGEFLLKKIENRLMENGCKRIELTIDPENYPSQNLFEKSGYHNVSNQEGETLYVKGNKAVKDYYKPGRHFMVYEKRLLNV